MLVPAEYVADVGHILLASSDERARLFARLARRGQYDRAHLERSLLHFRQRDLRLERAHAAGLVFAHDKLQAIFTGREVEAGSVLNIFLPRLKCRVEIQLDRFAGRSEEHTSEIQSL